MPKNYKRELTEEQKRILLQNPNVEDVGKYSIYYKKEFIQQALKLDNEGLLPREIFKQAGFDLSIIGKSAPTTCLGNWRHQNKFKTKSETKYLAKETKKNKALKAIMEENKYLKAENEFLKKLQALSEIAEQE